MSEKLNHIQNEIQLELTN